MSHGIYTGIKSPRWHFHDAPVAPPETEPSRAPLKNTMRVLAALEEVGRPITAVELARHMGVKIRQVSCALTNLKQRGAARYTGSAGQRNYPWEIVKKTRPPAPKQGRRQTK